MKTLCVINGIETLPAYSEGQYVTLSHMQYMGGAPLPSRDKCCYYTQCCVLQDLHSRASMRTDSPLPPPLSRTLSSYQQTKNTFKYLTFDKAFSLASRPPRMAEASNSAASTLSPSSAASKRSRLSSICRDVVSLLWLSWACTPIVTVRSQQCKAHRNIATI